MGDDLDRPERLAVRTPMQWSNEPNAGFSCTKGELAAPVIDEGPFSYEKINVFAQTLRSDSLMARTGNMIRTRIGLRTVYALAEPDPEVDPDHIGRIDAPLIAREVPDFRERIFYVSGPHGMVRQFQKTLAELGVARARIRVDYFPGFA